MKSEYTLTIDRSITLTSNTVISKTVWVAIFGVLTVAGAQIAIPTVPVPFTLQTLFVLLAGALLGARAGAYSQIAYLAAGAMGLPVFANGAGGFPHLFGPTGGYLLGFPIAAWLVGLIIHDWQWGQRIPRTILATVAMTLGLLLIFTTGVVQLNALYIHDWSISIKAGFISLQWWDALKLAAAVGMYTAISRKFTSASTS